MGKIAKLLSVIGNVLLIILGSSLSAKEPKRPMPSTEQNPPPKTPCPGNFFLQGDFLFWKAQQDGLVIYSDTSQATGTTLNSSPANIVEERSRTTNYHRPHFEGRPGFRVGVGYDFYGCDWEVFSDWTHLHGYGRISHGVTAGYWKLHYDILDTCVQGPLFTLGSSFAWRAIGGCRAAQISEQLKAVYQNAGVIFFPDSGVQSETTDLTRGVLRNHFRFKGIGPEIGVRTTWDLSQGVHLYANLAGSLVYNYLKNKSTTSVTDVTTTVLINAPSSTDQFTNVDFQNVANHSCQTVLDFAFGISWERYACLCNRSVGCVFKLGWEHAQWFDFANVGRTGDLFYDGLTLSGQVQF